MNIQKTYRYTASLLILMMLALTQSCGSNEKAMPAASVLVESTTQIDSLYLLINHSSEKDIIPNANNFFHQLDKIDVTDSLIQYNTSAPIGQVQANASYWMGEYLLAEGRYKEALATARAALDMATQISDTTVANDTHSLLSVIYFRLGMINDAIENLKICFDADSKSGNKEGMSSDLNNLAAMSIQAKQYENAKDYIDRAIAIERTLNRPDVLAIRLGIASETYALIDKLDEAEDFAREAYKLDMEGGRDCKAAIRLSQLATVLIKSGKDAEALNTLNIAAPILESCGNTYSYIVTQCQLGDLYFKQHNDAEASRHYGYALEMADSTDAMYLQQRALKGLWESTKNTDKNKAAQYIERYASVTDSMYASNTISADMAEMQSKFERQELEFDKERLIYKMRIQRLLNVGIAILVLIAVSWLLYIIYTRNKANKIIRNMEKVRSNFFTNITHEFRTPLTTILGLSKDISENRFTDKKELNQAVDIINRQGNELLELVNQLLDISKVKSEIGDPEWRYGDIVGYVSMIMNNFRSAAVNQQIELVFSCAQTAIEMDFVPDYIRKIVRNLVSNALKFTSRGGHVTVELILKNQDLIIRVADNGKGISKEDLPKIFDPYYSVSESQPDLSTGIGLSLVYEMVSALRGKIKVASKENKGSVFIVTLPITHNANIKQLAETSKAPSSSAENINETSVNSDSQNDADNSRQMALIVEDNADLAFYIGAHLPKDFAVYYAHNGKEGLEKALQIVPDIIITDIMMPEMDGMTMVEHIRKDQLINHIPVIAVTAKINDDDKVDGLRAGFDAYLAKPFNSEELTIRVTKLLEQRQMLREKYSEILKNGDEMDKGEKEGLKFISKLVDFVYRNLDKGNAVDIDICAKFLNISTRQLLRKVKAVTGENSSKYLNRIRIQYAKKLIDANPNIQIAEVSMRCGFDDPGYFSRLFRSYEGIAPSQYSNLPHND